MGIRGLTELTQFFDRYIIDGITNGVGIASFFIGEGIKSMGGGRISSYLFFYLFYALNSYPIYQSYLNLKDLLNEELIIIKNQFENYFKDILKF